MNTSKLCLTRFTKACAGLLTLLSLTGWSVATMASDYPTRTITVINPWTAGGPADTVARPILQKLSEVLKQPVVLENKAGANGVIGANYVARATPDGYTLLFSHVGPITISPAVQKDMPYDSIRDFAPITLIVSAPTVLVVRPDLPIHNLKEFIEYARANPGKLSYGSVGIGSTTHLAGEILATMADVKMLHVPYKGAAPVMNDLLGGQINCTFLNIAALLPYIKSGQVRAIGVSTLKRSSLLPELPAIAETYPGFEVNSWYGMMAPAKTPAHIVERLQKEVAKILQLPEIVQSLQASGLSPEGTTPAQYATQIQTDLKRWQTVVAKAGIEKQ
ncbi:MAG: tripartite tricarboxylate transporter substrate binding protein [Alcaligenaceae bacterium]|nr:tripartite tricarboxylate transporter substrate binding protein [Alcaligenaceae bacterium]